MLQDNEPQYVDRIWLQGRIQSVPTIKQLSPRTKMTSFLLVTVEQWRDDDGKPKTRNNLLPIEVIGRDSEEAFARARPGLWVTIEGYVRSDIVKGQNVHRVRTFNIHIWEHNAEPAGPSIKDDPTPA